MISRLRRRRTSETTATANGLVLMYHGFGVADIDPWGLFVSPANFEAHLEVLHDRAHPMSLDDLVAAQEGNRLPGRAVAITMDDGYANIAHVASPILEARQIPATLFAISAPLIEGGEYWWDQLAGLILVPGTLPARLDIGTGRSRLNVDLGPAAAYSDKQWKADHRFRDGDKPGPRMALYLQLWNHLMALGHQRRNELLSELARWAGVSFRPRNSHRNATIGELQRLDGDVVTVGGHTMTHPLLPELSFRRQRKEIVQNKRHLESVLGRPLRSFSYPFGGHNKETVAAVRSAGYQMAVTTKPTPVSCVSDPLRVGRFDVKDWDGEEFARRLEGWLSL